MAWDPESALVCSSCGEDVLGTIAIVGHADEEQPNEWGELTVYTSSTRQYVQLHPKCLHDTLDEVLRQESAVVLVVALGPVDDVRMAMEI